MARIWTTRGDLLDQLSEVVLFKTGLLLTERELREHAGEDELLRGDPAHGVTLRAEEYEDLVYLLLHRVGYTDTPSPVAPPLAFARKYMHDEHKMKIFQAIMESLGTCGKARREGEPVDLTPMISGANESFGPEGLALALEFYNALLAHVHRSPWSQMRRVEWQDDARLRDLFESESLATPHGTFFDQRYIDYLAAQFEGSIDRVHWRKFEGLTCEYFDRLGCRVEIGPGRDDDNVDARVWWPDESSGAPATLLIQCKRERENIGKMVVKALYADVLWEKSTAGLVVTTQRLAPGADRVRIARGYPIGEADRRVLRDWILRMRSSR